MFDKWIRKILLQHAFVFIKSVETCSNKDGFLEHKLIESYTDPPSCCIFILENNIVQTCSRIETNQAKQKPFSLESKKTQM